LSERPTPQPCPIVELPGFISGVQTRLVRGGRCMMLTLPEGGRGQYLGLTTKHHERTTALCLCAPASAMATVLIHRDQRAVRIAQFLIPFVSLTLHGR
jgi:hypothetical protein